MVVVDPSSSSSTAADDDDSSWQVQTKPRRLGPQHSLSRQDLEEQTNKVPLEKKNKGMMMIVMFIIMRLG